MRNLVFKLKGFFYGGDYRNVYALDTCLIAFEKHQYLELDYFGQFNEPPQLYLAIEHLVVDGMIKPKGDGYQITFKGSAFFNRGGYEKQAFQNALRNAVIFATFVVSLVSLMLALFRGD